MKLRKEDLVMVIAGRDKGKTGKVLAVLPATDQVVVEQINVIKRHTKATAKTRGGIIEINKPMPISKVMAIDPASGQPARIGYRILPDGSKERIYRVSAARQKAKSANKEPKKATGDMS